MSLPADPSVPVRPELSGQTVLVLHAHPDDEAIFTGITMRRLADAGARVVLVMATGGELGDSRLPLHGDTVARRRRRELERAAELLGVARLVMLGHRDSGLLHGPDPRALARADRLDAGRRLAELADAESAATLVFDDAPGVYGHPDHRAAHAIGAVAATLTGADAYHVTVDREHLRLVHRAGRARHLVHGAARSAATGYGRVTAEITTAVTGTDSDLDVKRAAMLAHASQIDPDTVGPDEFRAVYGYEWFHREGPPGVLDRLGNVHLLAGTRHS